MMDMQNMGIYMPGLAIVFLYAMSQFNKIPPAGRNAQQEGSTVLSTVRQWFQYKELPPLLISSPLRANTTAFKYWLYRLAYALIWVLVYTAIMRVPGVREPIPAIIEVLTGNTVISKLNLTNGVVVSFVIMMLVHLPPFRGADATIRQAMYERASIPAQQLGFQYLLRGASYEPGTSILQDTGRSLVADGFAARDIELDPEPSTRSLWAKTSVLMKHIESWGKLDRYKTALSLLRDPGSEKLSANRVRNDYEALKSDARICLAQLRRNPRATETRLREEQFRRECKTLLEALYNLLTRVALRSHYSYGDALKAVKQIGFVIEGSIAPLPDKNDVVALSILLFFVTTLPLAYRLGVGRAISITGIYLMAVLTPIYLAAECPRLLRRRPGGIPPLAFPLAAAAIAGPLTAGVSIAMGGICPGSECVPWFSIDAGLERLLHRSYPWVVLVCFLTTLISTLMLIGKHPEQGKPDGNTDLRKWGSIRDAIIISGGVLGLMALFVVPELHRLVPERFPEAFFWRAPGLTLKPVLTSFFIGFLVPAWYRGNMMRIREDRMSQYIAKQTLIQDAPAAP